MNLLQSYKRSRFFLLVNILGLSIGLAVSIMLVLFVTNELSYDRHFKNSDRIINLNSHLNMKGTIMNIPYCPRIAYTEIPNKVAGIEAAAQIFNLGEQDIIVDDQTLRGLTWLVADLEFFKIFDMKFLAGTPETALESTSSFVITRPYAEALWGSAEEALNKSFHFYSKDYVVSAVVEPLPSNTHFTFDIVTPMKSIPDIDAYPSLDFFTYYLIDKEADRDQVMKNMDEEYSAFIKERYSPDSKGYTEKLIDIYLRSQSDVSLGKSNDMKFIWLLTLLAVFILLLAITNFINLYMAQGEMRMNEIAIRKTNGASVKDIIHQFFSEVSLIIFIAFVIGIVLAVIFTPHFSFLIKREIDFSQLLNPLFILSLVLLFIITVVFSAAYPSLYLSRFSPLEIFGKRMAFSKQNLKAIIVVFQSIITIVLLSYILMIHKQTEYLENIPKNYQPENVVAASTNGKIMEANYAAFRQELMKNPMVERVSGATHIIGLGGSGQGISLLEDPEDVYFLLDEYRIMPGLAEVVGFELLEGEFFQEDRSTASNPILLNEAAIKKLGLQLPVVGKQVNYKGPATIIGVVKDFIYRDPSKEVQPIVISLCWENAPAALYAKFSPNVSRAQAEELILNTFRSVAPDALMSAIWLEDVYVKKFESIKTQSVLIFIATGLSVFIAMLGLLAIHLYTALRRIREIGIRRINGADGKSIISLLTQNVVLWILIASVIAIPLAFYIINNWLNNYAFHTSVSIDVFFIPIQYYPRYNR